jgi:hypothetical protein
VAASSAAGPFCNKTISHTDARNDALSPCMCSISRFRSSNEFHGQTFNMEYLGKVGKSGQFEEFTSIGHSKKSEIFYRNAPSYGLSKEMLQVFEK